MYEILIEFENNKRRKVYSNEDIVTSLSIGGVRKIIVQHAENDIITPINISVHSIEELNELGLSKMYNIGRYFNIDIVEELVKQSIHDYTLFEHNVNVDTGVLLTNDMSYFSNKYNPTDIESYEDDILKEIAHDREEFEYFLNELLYDKLFFYYEVGSGRTLFITLDEYKNLLDMYKNTSQIESVKKIVEYIEDNGELLTDELFTILTEIFTIIYSTDAHNEKNNTQGLEFYNLSRFVGEGKEVVKNLNEKRLISLYNIYKSKIKKKEKSSNKQQDSKVKKVKLSMYIPSISAHTGISIQELNKCNLLQIHSYITVLSNKYNMQFVNDILSSGNGSKELKSINWLTGGRNE